MLDWKIERGLFAIPHPAHEAVNNLLTRLIFHGYVKEKYKPGILAGLRQDSAEVRKQFAEMFGDRLAHALVDDLAQERWSVVEARTGAMRRSLVLRRCLREPVATGASMWREMWRVLGRLRRPPGMVVVLLGADGCGKSSVATRLIADLCDTFAPDKGSRVHWKPAVLSRQRRAERPPTTDPHGQSPRGRLASLGALLFHWCEFFLGAWTQFLPVRFRNGLVLVDRYHYDFLVDPRRYRLRVGEGFVRLLFGAIPAPDLVFLLDAPPEVLRARKQEVAPAETQRQREAYLALAHRLPEARIVDAAQPLEVVVRDIAGQILRFLAARQEQRRLR
jgi:thymidylate kinase